MYTRRDKKRKRARNRLAAGQRNRTDGGYCYVLQYSFFFSSSILFLLFTEFTYATACDERQERKKTPNKARSTLLHHIKCNKVGNHQSCARMARVYIIYIEWCVFETPLTDHTRFAALFLFILIFAIDFGFSPVDFLFYSNQLD